VPTAASGGSGSGCFIATVADYIREHETLRSVVRTGLNPLMELSRQMVSLGMHAAQK